MFDGIVNGIFNSFPIEGMSISLFSLPWWGPSPVHGAQTAIKSLPFVSYYTRGESYK